MMDFFQYPSESLKIFFTAFVSKCEWDGSRATFFYLFIFRHCNDDTSDES